MCFAVNIVNCAYSANILVNSTLIHSSVFYTCFVLNAIYLSIEGAIN